MSLLSIVNRSKFSIVLLCFQILFLVLFAIFVDYGEDASPRRHHDASHELRVTGSSIQAVMKKRNSLAEYYPMFQDVHVMIYIGFGFLMTFLKKYGYGAAAINMLIAAFAVQWRILLGGFLSLDGGKIHISVVTLLTAEFAAAAILISFGAVLGKLSPLQLVIMSFLEIIVFVVNEFIGVEMLKAVDIGGSMFVHVFGAYFGLAVARVLYADDVEKSSKEGSDYRSDLFSIIGTLFLWLFWPSFNAALAPGDAQHRAVINTYFALASCSLVAFAASSMVDKRGKFNMVHIQNATLAGGVAVGTSADLMIHPWGAILIGCLAGSLSVVGFRFLQPALLEKFKFHDTCGVNNLHEMPGILGGLAGAIVVAMATTDTYNSSLYEIIPAMSPALNSSQLSNATSHDSLGLGRSPAVQAGYQVIALAVTIATAGVGGLLTGLVLRLPFLDQPTGTSLFDDVEFWELPEQDLETKYSKVAMVEIS